MAEQWPPNVTGRRFDPDHPGLCIKPIVGYIASMAIKLEDRFIVWFWDPYIASMAIKLEDRFIVWFWDPKMPGWDFWSNEASLEEAEECAESSAEGITSHTYKWHITPVQLPKGL